MMKRIAFSFIAFILFLALAESAARLVESQAARGAKAPDEPGGWQEKFFGSVFDWHEPDPDLLWRFKADLDNRYIRTNGRHTIGNDIPAEKGPAEYRILLLGDSSPIGLGLKSYRLAFGELLRGRLQKWYANSRDVRLINAAVSGYSSEQLVRYLERDGWGYQPDLVILYCGNNDASISGFHHDRELMEHQGWRWPREWLSHLALYRLMRAVLAPDDPLNVTDPAALKVRVTPQRYGENLRAIAAQCQSRDCPLVIVKPPVPLLWPAGLQFKPFVHLKGSDGQLVLPSVLTACLDRPIRYCLGDRFPFKRPASVDKFTAAVYASAFRDTLKPQAAIQDYTAALETDPHSPIILNNLGVAEWETGRYEVADNQLLAARREYSAATSGRTDPAALSFGAVFLFNIGVSLLTAASVSDEPSMTRQLALTYLDSALQADYLSLRTKRSYLMQIDELAGEFDNVSVVDGQKLFDRDDGEALFIDHCHPTERGHQLLADKLFDVVTGAEPRD